MATLSRKQREIQDREERFLDAAWAILLERGYLGLTMERVAEATEYSKGTVYQHFRSKEDLLAALLLRTGRIRAGLFERAATFRGSTRERMNAIGIAVELLYRLHPEAEQIEHLLKAASIRSKASREHLERLDALDQRCLGVCFGITRDAIAQGDLALPPGFRVEDVTFALWSLFQGAFFLLRTELPFAQLGFGEPIAVLRRSAQILLDGLGWRPLSHEFGEDRVRARILTEVFAEEAARLGDD